MTVVGTRISSSTRAMVSPVSSGRPSVTITSNCLPCAAERGGASSVLAPVASRAAPAPPARRRGRAPAWQPVRANTRQMRAGYTGRGLTAAAALRRMAMATREWPCTSTVAPLRMKRSPVSAIVARARFDVSAQ